ncbi:MAG: hypothetical protein HC880_06530 [Bacteroidia bacterium]|nr:hypothetical protein [Bacteroidia bacterium]
MKNINPNYTTASEITKLREQFEQAQPYKHLVLDDFLNKDIAQALYEQFPSIDKLNKHYKGLNENKSEGANFSDFHPAFSEIKQEITSEEFARWVSAVTGIENAFVTDDKLGTGLHQGSNGSFLDVHIDFNIHAEKMSTAGSICLFILIKIGSRNTGATWKCGMPG